jgi:predicted Zn-dependent peptidase
MSNLAPDNQPSLVDQLLAGATFRPGSYLDQVAIQEFSNGLRLYTCNMSGTNAVWMRVLTECGARHDPEQLGGMAAVTQQLLSHSMHERYHDTLESLPATAFGRLDVEYQLLSANCLSFQLDQVGEILISELARDDYDASELQRAKSEVQAVQHRDTNFSPEFGLELLNQCVFAGSPLAHSRFGQEGVGDITLKELQDHRRKFIEPSRMCVSLAGGLSEKATAKIAQLLEALPSHPPSIADLRMPQSDSVPASRSRALTGEIRCYEIPTKEMPLSKRHLNLGSVHIGYPIRNLSGYSHTVFEIICTGLAFHMAEVQSHCQLATGKHTSLVDYIPYRSAGMLYFAFSGKNPIIGDLLLSFGAEVEKFLAKFNEQTLMKIKERHLVQLVRDTERPEYISDYLVTQDFANRLDVIGADKLFESISAISVAQIKSALVDLMHPSNLFMVANGDKGMLDDAKAFFDAMTKRTTS